MPKIQFSHSNGFPSPSFAHLFELIDADEFFYVKQFGCNNYPVTNDYGKLVDELIDHILAHGQYPIVGMGHSSGATITALAACKRPELFSQLILIEPIIFRPFKRFVVFLMRNFGLKNYIGPAKRTLGRKNVFDSRTEAKTYFSAKSLFKNFHPQCFNDYIQHGLTETTDGKVTLSIPREVEASIFSALLVKLPKGLRKINATILYGNQSKTIDQADVKWWKKALKNCEIIGLDGGHMFPLEQPEKTAEIINELIEKPN